MRDKRVTAADADRLDALFGASVPLPDCGLLHCRRVTLQIPVSCGGDAAVCAVISECTHTRRSNKPELVISPGEPRNSYSLATQWCGRYSSGTAMVGS